MMIMKIALTRLIKYNIWSKILHVYLQKTFDVCEINNISHTVI